MSLSLSATSRENPEMDSRVNASRAGNRMKQTIRAQRKRHFNAKHQHTRKKSIDLEYLVWQCLAALAQRRGNTMSETIINLLEDAERKEKLTKLCHRYAAT